MSPGGGFATDPGSTTFGVGATHAQSVSTDMLYDFTDVTQLTAGTPFFSGSLGAGMLSSVVFSTDPTGITHAVGL